MGLFNFGGKAADSSGLQKIGSVFGFGKDGLLKSAKMAIKGSGLAIRKAYELRINVVNEFSDIKPDWSFLDIDTLKNNIRETENELYTVRSQANDGIQQLEEVQRLIEKLLILNALMEDNLDTCDAIVEEYHFSSPFARHGLRCLRCAENKDFSEALTQSLLYYTANHEISEHPRVSFFITKALINKGEYQLAQKVIKDVIRSYPEDKAVHRLLLQLHQRTGNEVGAEMEKIIISML